MLICEYVGRGERRGEQGREGKIRGRQRTNVREKILTR